MDLTVSIEDKKYFLNHFVKAYKSSDIIWFFEDLLKSHIKLKQVHFVEKLSAHHRGLYVVVDDYRNLFYFFKKGRVKLKNIQTAYHELNANYETPFYIAMNLTDERIAQPWQQVVEMSASYKENLKLDTEIFLNNLSQINQVKWIESQIDKSLANRDKHAFDKYVTLLNGIKTTEESK